jgi:tRNA pseudouridine38-40 synthase
MPYAPCAMLREMSLITIDIEADGFLYNMVRTITGTLIEIGRGRFPKGSMKKILVSRNRKKAGPTLPAHGLCLMEVKY